MACIYLCKYLHQFLDDCHQYEYQCIVPSAYEACECIVQTSRSLHAVTKIGKSQIAPFLSSSIGSASWLYMDVMPSSHRYNAMMPESWLTFVPKESSTVFLSREQ